MTRQNLQGIELVVDGKYIWVRPGTKIEEQPEETENSNPGRESTVDNG